MRSFATALLCVALAAPAAAQTCLKVPPPPLVQLFPASAGGMPVEFATDPTGGVTAMYRPATAEERTTRPWAIVAMEGNGDPGVGETAEDVRERYSGLTGFTLFEMGGWPVALHVVSMGDEFITFRGSVRIVVQVKNGDHGQASTAVARPIFEAILAKVPCGD
jgi:hypothetical protein